MLPDWLSSLGFSEPIIMGILNVTPDSFSDGGKYFDSQYAVERGLRMLEEGAEIIDIGGESSRPGAVPISQTEEISRIIPVIESILKYSANAKISVDTYRSKTASLALDAGAWMINDISGGLGDPDMFSVVGSSGAPYVLMHMQGIPESMQDNPSYTNVVGDICNFLQKQVEVAKTFGINRIILDPGIGFGKLSRQNFTLLKNINQFRELGYPILIGLSRKSFIGNALNLTVSERDLPTVMLEMFSVLQGSSIIRTHNIQNAIVMKTLVSEINNG
ncbi:MAG: dihydropteroate synthase [Ignavibacteria bacterium]|nr:dihydropteroate synthase [Ignavibacteria bacterium]